MSVITPFNPVYSRLRDRSLYRSSNLNAPLAEQTLNVVQFEAASGCSHNRCTYCTLFKNEPYEVKTLYEFQRHVVGVLDALSVRGEVSGLERIFLGNGDALSIDTSLLQSMIDISISEFKRATGRLPRRVAMYASLQNVLTKSNDDLAYLHCGGTCSFRDPCSLQKYGTRIGLELLYLGMETGSSELLKKIAKGYTATQMYHAFAMLNKVGTALSSLNISAFVMPGLGGEAYSQEHITQTADALNVLRPKFINLMTLNEHTGSPYATWMDRESKAGTNRRLTADEIVLQIASILECLSFTTTIGCFDNTCYLGRDTNSVKFPSVKLTPSKARLLASGLRDAVLHGLSNVDPDLIDRLGR